MGFTTNENLLQKIETYLSFYPYTKLDKQSNVQKTITEDVLPVTIAIADPEIVKIGISIQQNYPLGMIHRQYGIPYAKMNSDPIQDIYNYDYLHTTKMPLEAHETIFEINAANDFILEELRKQDNLEQKNRVVVTALSTGLGNLLQNKNCVAFINEHKGILYHVDGQEFDDHPFPCLVRYKDKDQIGVELLLFTPNGERCDRINGKQFFEGDPKLSADALNQADQNFQEQILWAVSGYPLILDGQNIEIEYLARYISDYRHLWKLPRLAKSLVEPIQSVSQAEYKDKEKIEFYYGFHQLQHDDISRFNAIYGKLVTLPLYPEMPPEWFTQVYAICKIANNNYSRNWVFNEHQVNWNPDKLQEDFEDHGYQCVSSKNEVKKEGQFCIDQQQGKIFLIFQPAAYPHHIVGITDEKKPRIISISIGGLSGRSGITIKNAQEFCHDIGLRDAIIFDNGNDVISRITKGPVIRHRNNVRQTRLTAALHFGSLVDSSLSGSDFEGLEISYKTIKVTE